MNPEWIGLPVDGVVHCLSAPGLGGPWEGWDADSTGIRADSTARTGIARYYVTDSKVRRNRERDVDVSRVTQG